MLDRGRAHVRLASPGAGAMWAPPGGITFAEDMLDAPMFLNRKRPARFSGWPPVSDFQGTEVRGLLSRALRAAAQRHFGRIDF